MRHQWSPYTSKSEVSPKCAATYPWSLAVQSGLKGFCNRRSNVLSLSWWLPEKSCIHHNSPMVIPLEMGGRGGFAAGPHLVRPDAFPPRFGFGCCESILLLSGEAKAPVLTIFIGGNHEASNHNWELYGTPLFRARARVGNC